MSDINTRRLTVCAAAIAVAATQLIGSQLTPISAQNVAGESADASIATAGDAKVRVIEMGLIIQRLATDADGHFACVFGQPSPQRSDDDPRARFDRETQLYGPPTHVVLVNLKTGDVSVPQKIDGNVEQTLVDDKFLFWKPTSVNVIDRLALTGAGSLEQLSLPVAIEGMFFVGDDRLALVIGEGRTARLHVYDRQSFRRLPDDPLGRFVFDNRQREYGGMVHEVGDGEVYLSPLVIDQEAGTAKCIVDKSYIPSLAPGAVPGHALASAPRDRFLWRRHDWGDELHFGGGRSPFDLPTDYWSISRTRPLLAGVVHSGPRFDVSRQLEIRDVIFGKRLEQIAIGKENLSRIARRNGIQFAGDNVVLAMFDSLSVVKVAPETLQAAAEPFRLVHPVLSVASYEEPMEFFLEARGGSPPYRFSLELKIDGVSIDESTGAVKIDCPSIWKQRLENVANATEPQFQYSDLIPALPHQPELTPEERFERSTGVGTPQDMFPTALPLTLTGTDSSGQQDRMVAQAIVMVPKQKIKEANIVAMETRAAQQARMMAEIQAKRQTDANQGATNIRIADIEKRLKRIEALLDMVLEKLDENAGTGREN